mmetsp:Transcript_82602/g.223806  ORF Transcript_82602/g.223806 Transcript_82602/m.223806 type:complete len:128 (+) Transcript_82602:90-473(+)
MCAFAQTPRSLAGVLPSHKSVHRRGGEERRKGGGGAQRSDGGEAEEGAAAQQPPKRVGVLRTAGSWEIRLARTGVVGLPSPSLAASRSRCCKKSAAYCTNFFGRKLSWWPPTVTSFLSAQPHALWTS